MVGFVAFRWSRKHDDAMNEAPTTPEPDMDQRLDDELRNLD